MLKSEIPPSQMKRERQKAKELKKSRWWQNAIQECNCYYCGVKLNAQTATMDHIVPISRGGRSNRGNLVIACLSCNQKKKSMTAVEWVLYQEENFQASL